MEITTDALLWLGLIAVVAGLVDSIAGGGGLITVPAMLLFQVPPINALATNKLQGSFGTATAALIMLKRGKVNLAQPIAYFLLALAGGVAGTIVVQLVTTESLQIMVPLILTIIALYFLLAKNHADIAQSARLGEATYANAVVPTIAAYDGFLGPGAGTFYAFAGVALRGQPLVTSTANAKLLNFGSNIASLGVFIIGGKVFWLVGGVMIIGQMLGAYLGTLAVMFIGAKLIRPIIVSVCLLMILRNAEQQGLLYW